MHAPTLPASAPRQRAAVLVLALLASAPLPLLAQAPTAEEVVALRAELEALKQEQATRDAKIARLESALLRLEGRDAAKIPAAAVATVPASGAAATSTRPVAAVPGSPPLATSAATASTPAPAPASSTTSRLQVSGDLRVRGQGDVSDSDGRDRWSTQLRGRLGATYRINDRITAGARLATGDADDPNSTDVQLSNWLDDLDVSLDQAYLRFHFDGLDLYAGKMPQPFTRTELVWDGDVNPQGLGATWKHALAGGGTLRANGLAFVVDEAAGGPDSTMLGAQFGYDTPKSGRWSVELSGAYFHYNLGSIAGADAGDFRSNLRDGNGDYLSEFHLANAIVGVNYIGFGERWPVRVVGDVVKNLGAATDDDSGYGVDVTVGRASQPGDWRLTFGHATAQADAVLAAFSQDNIGIATNYRMHALTADFVPMPKTLVSAIWYHYRPYDAIHAGSNAPTDWLDRFRLAFMVSF